MNTSEQGEQPHRNSPSLSGLSRYLLTGLVIVAVLAASGWLWLEQSGQLNMPAITAHKPADTGDLAPTTPLSLSFNTWMDHTSVEQSIKISPQHPVSFQWNNDTLVITPQATGWDRGQAYLITVDPLIAHSRFGKPLAQPFSVNFKVMDVLRVVMVQPQEHAIEVDPTTRILVQFNHPVVALTTLQEGKERDATQQVIHIDPPLEGKGRWLTTGIYVFEPAKGLNPSTSYKVSIDPELSDTGNGKLEQAFSWSFQTVLPNVTSISPADNTKFGGPRQEVVVGFIQPMDHPSTEAALVVAPASGGTAVPGSFVWGPTSTVLTYTPAVDLALNTAYKATVNPGARGQQGNQGTTKAVTATFTTAGAPALAQIITPKTPNEQTITLVFTTPMDRASVEKNLNLLPRPTQVYTSWTDSDTHLVLFTNLQPSSDYRIEVKAGATDRYGRSLPQTYAVAFVTPQRAPSFNVETRAFSGTYNAYDTPEIYASYVNIKTIRYRLSRIELTQFLVFQRDFQARAQYTPPTNTIIRSWDAGKLTAAKNETGYIRSRLSPAADGKLPPGLYLLEASSPDVQGQNPFRLLLSVSRSHLAMQQSENEVLVWAVDFASGKVLSGLPVTLINQDGAVLVKGSTDGDGIYRTQLKHNPYEPIYAVMQANGDHAVCATTWQDGYEAYNFDVAQNLIGVPYRTYIYTDRPIYRPDQTVYYKGIVRADDDAQYTLPSGGTQVLLSVRDPQFKEIMSKTVTLNELGDFSGELKLETKPALGTYTINISTGTGREERQIGTARFTVAEYRKPDYQVSVETPKPEYTNGEEIEVTVNANYYFGAPVPNSPVTWRVVSRDYIFWLGRDANAPNVAEDYRGFTFTDSDFFAQPQTGNGTRERTQGQGMTDDKGMLTVKIPSTLVSDSLSQVFVIEASVKDINNQEVSSNIEVIVHKAAFYAGIKPLQYVGTAGTRQEVRVVTVDPQGKPVANRNLTVQFFRRTWSNVQEQRPDGSTMWVSKPNDEPVGQAQVTTDGKGFATAGFTPDQGGVYRALVTGQDDAGHAVRASTYIWVSSSSFVSWQVENNDRIRLVADKASYAPGDTAKVLVTSPVTGTDALVTLERGHILETRHIQLQSNSETLEIPISSDYVPNVYVSVWLFKGQTQDNPVAQFKMGLIDLPVATKEKQVNVSITTAQNRDRFQPGDKVTFVIKTTDAGDHPVQADLSFALLDASVLALADDTSGSMLDAFWNPRPVGISSSANMALSIDRLNEQVAKGAKGAGDGGSPAQTSTRTYFPDTAVWEATIRTGATGEARLDVTLPDSLTTWRARVKAVTGQTQVGTRDADFIATKDVLVRPVVPRFLIQGDEVTLGAIAHNYTGAQLDATVGLQVDGIGVQGNQFQPIHVTIAKDGTQKVGWPLKVPGGITTITVTLTLTPSNNTIPGDALALRIPVHLPVAREITASAGEVQQDGKQTEIIRLPDDGSVRTDQGSLTVEASPSLAAGLRYSRQYLDEFTWESTEQTISRFLPRVVMYRAYKQIGLSDPDNTGNVLPDLVTRSLQRLYQDQHTDGGWGWWSSEQSNPYITAYAVYGMAEARKSGFAVDQSVLDAAIRYLRNYLGQPADVKQPANANTRAFVLAALANAGAGDQGLMTALYENRAALGIDGHAFLAMALYETLGGTANDPRLTTLLGEIHGKSIDSATSTHWEESTSDYSTMATDIRSTALALDAIARIEGINDARVPNTIRWLMQVRKDGHWSSTQETAWSLLALTDYLSTSKELAGNYSFTISLNGKQQGDPFQVNRDNLEQSRIVAIAIPDLLKAADNQLVIERGPGAGRLYYTLHLDAYVPADQVQATSEGVTVVREYLDPATNQVIPSSSVKAGDLVKVRLTVLAPNDLNYLVVDDPLPAGFEAVDTRLKTTSITAQTQTGGQRQPEKGENPQNPTIPFSRYYFSTVDVHDDRVGIFAGYLPRGTYEYTYLMRGTTPGKFNALPTTAYQMYFPEVFGRSDGAIVDVTP